MEDNVLNIAEELSGNYKIINDLLRDQADAVAELEAGDTKDRMTENLILLDQVIQIGYGLIYDLVKLFDLKQEHPK